MLYIWHIEKAKIAQNPAYYRTSILVKVFDAVDKQNFESIVLVGSGCLRLWITQNGYFKLKTRLFAYKFEIKFEPFGARVQQIFHVNFSRFLSIEIFKYLNIFDPSNFKHLNSKISTYQNKILQYLNIEISKIFMPRNAEI